MDWPGISIVTPSYNQGQFLEATLCSVLGQGYPNLEYIVIDGGSTDNSVEIIRKYEKHLTCWVSEPDRGQAHALNKGFTRATGEIANWINSDDMLLPGALHAIAEAWRQHPSAMICGDVEFVYEGAPERNYSEKLHDITLENMICYWREACEWEQPCMFWPLQTFRDVGALDEAQYIAMDYDLFCRLLQKLEVHYIDAPVARIRRHPDAKTVRYGYSCWLENRRVSKHYWSHLAEGVDLHEFKQTFVNSCMHQARRALARRDWSAVSRLIAAAFAESAPEIAVALARRAVRAGKKRMHRAAD